MSNHVVPYADPIILAVSQNARLGAVYQASFMTPPRVRIRKVGELWRTTCRCPNVSTWSQCADYTLMNSTFWHTALWYANKHIVRHHPKEHP